MNDSTRSDARAQGRPPARRRGVIAFVMLLAATLLATTVAPAGAAPAAPAQVATTTVTLSTAAALLPLEPVVMGASVTAPDGTAVTTGAVTFLEGDEVLGTAAIQGPGNQAVFALDYEGEGTHTYTARYDGDGTIPGATSTPATVTIAPEQRYGHPLDVKLTLNGLDVPLADGVYDGFIEDPGDIREVSFRGIKPALAQMTVDIAGVPTRLTYQLQRTGISRGTVNADGTVTFSSGHYFAIRSARDAQGFTYMPDCRAAFGTVSSTGAKDDAAGVYRLQSTALPVTPFRVGTACPIADALNTLFVGSGTNALELTLGYESTKLAPTVEVTGTSPEAPVVNTLATVSVATTGAEGEPINGQVYVYENDGELTAGRPISTSGGVGSNLILPDSHADEHLLRAYFRGNATHKPGWSEPFAFDLTPEERPGGQPVQGVIMLNGQGEPLSESTVLVGGVADDGSISGSLSFASVQVTTAIDIPGFDGEQTSVSQQYQAEGTTTTGQVNADGTVTLITTIGMQVKIVRVNGTLLFEFPACRFEPMEMALTGTYADGVIRLDQSGFTVPPVDEVANPGACNGLSGSMNPVISGSNNSVHFELPIETETSTSLAVTAERTLGPSLPMGHELTLTASLTGASAGTVEFLDGRQVIGSAEAVDGVATLTTDDLRHGMHNLKARYAGTVVRDASTSGGVPAIVTPSAASCGRQPWWRSSIWCLFLALGQPVG